MTDFMTPEAFVSKIQWEGGVSEALDYGLKASDLDPDDPTSTDLRTSWAALEAAYGPVCKALDALDADDE